MNTKASWITTAALLAGLLGLGAGAAWANDPDFGVFTVRIQPNVDLGVNVDTTGSAWEGSPNLDITMNLGEQKRLDTGVKLRITGNFHKQELELQALSLNDWTLNEAETDVQNKLRLHALIGADQAAPPDYALFDGAVNLVKESGVVRAGQTQADESADDNHVYEFSNGQGAVYADVDDMAVDEVRRLWLRSDTPTSSTYDGQQAFTITVTALSGSGQ